MIDQKPADANVASWQAINERWSAHFPDGLPEEDELESAGPGFLFKQNRVIGPAPAYSDQFHLTLEGNDAAEVLTEVGKCDDVWAVITTRRCLVTDLYDCGRRTGDTPSRIFASYDLEALTMIINLAASTAIKPQLEIERCASEGIAQTIEFFCCGRRARFRAHIPKADRRRGSRRRVGSVGCRRLHGRT